MKTIHLRPMEETLAETTALCPACLKTLAARRVRRGAQVFLERTCPEHGTVSTLIWNGAPSYESWGGAAGRGWRRRRPMTARAPAGCAPTTAAPPAASSLR